MDYDFLEKEFIKLISEVSNNKFYMPTDEHSSGFNQIEIDDMEDGTYSISMEDMCCIDRYLTFVEIIEEYPKITLSKNHAFYGNFCIWDDIYKAFKGEKYIELLEI